MVRVSIKKKHYKERKHLSFVDSALGSTWKHVEARGSTWKQTYSKLGQNISSSSNADPNDALEPK